MTTTRYISVLFLVLLTACQNKQSQTGQLANIQIMPDTTSVEIAKAMPELLSATALHLDSLGLVNIAKADSSFIVHLMYATPDNFTGQLLYTDLKEAYLHPDAAKALIRANRALHEEHPDYRLIIYDATRPLSVQQKMWDVVKGTSKRIYVSNPAHGGGLHNYGLAVDISIADSVGNVLPMGTEVDYMGPEAHITAEPQLVKEGKIRKEERENRLLLRRVMKKGGFRALPSEWWHFNLCSRDEARKRYRLIK